MAYFAVNLSLPLFVACFLNIKSFCRIFGIRSSSVIEFCRNCFGHTKVHPSPTVRLAWLKPLTDKKHMDAHHQVIRKKKAHPVVIFVAVEISRPFPPSSDV